MPQQSVRALGSRYQLEEILGSGAMGQVWRARDLRTGEAVAAKLLREELTADPQIVGRFVQERSILVDLVHPHIVAVRDLVVDGGDLGIVMDLVDGRDLRAHLTELGTLAPAEAVRITVDVLDALAAAHARAVLHRDVKPDNVLLDLADPPYVRLTDFGIARLAQETTVRMTGVLGTAEYIAPEVFTAETVSAAADVYGAGIQLYELLAGRTPFAGGGTSYAIAYRHVTAPPPPIPGLPAALTPVLAAMLAKTPGDRPSASAAATALRAAAGSLAGLAPLAPLAAPVWADVAAPPVAVRGSAPAEARDGQATMIKGAAAAPAPPKPLAAPQPGAALVPDAAPEALSSQTQLGGPRTARPVVDVPVAPLLEPVGHRRRTVLVAAAAVVAVGGLAGGGFVLLGGGHAGSKKAAPITLSTTAGAETDDTAYSGLTVSRTATYSIKDKQVTMQLVYKSSGPALTGPFYEAVPAPTGGAPCPTPDYAGATAGQDTSAIDASYCGLQLTLPSGDTVKANDPVTVTYTLPYTLTTDNPTTEMGSYAAAEQKQTDAALGSISGFAYPAQRLTGVTTTVAAPVLGKPIEVEADPVWLGASGPDGNDPLYTNADAASPPSYVAQLGGISAPFSTDCSNAVVQADHVLTADQTASGCTVQFTLGGTTQTPASNPFAISLPGG